MSEILTQPLFWISLAGMLVGVLGSVLPGLPGVPLVFLSALVYAYITGFEVVGGWVVAVLAVFAALALVADFIGTSYGARRFGASNWGTVGGMVGGIVGAVAGLLFFGIGALFGLILGSIAGVFAGEYLRRQRRGADDSSPSDPETSGSSLPRESNDWRRTSRAAGGVLVGYVISSVAQVILAVAGVVIFLIAAFN